MSHEKIPDDLFETAVEALIYGEATTLRLLLDQHPDLIRARSARPHKAHLLHYIGANGVEDERQVTPPNAVELTQILLDAGAEVDAVAELYGGSTTLGLVATSIHPLKAGLQKELIDILMDYGAEPDLAVAPDYTDGYLINACLANGRGEAAAYLAAKGAEMNLEAAAGVGDLDRVKSYFRPDGGLKESVHAAQRDAGFIWACEYGRVEVVRFLLENGVAPSTEAKGMTALHWAVIGGQTEIISLLLDLKAPLEIKNEYGGTVLGQAIWSAYNDPKPQYLAIIDTLIAAGAIVNPEWEKYLSELKSLPPRK